MSHTTTWTCDECKGLMSIDSYGGDSPGFFRVTPPFWAREELLGRASEIELCGPECATLFFRRFADHGTTWEKRFADHRAKEEKGRQETARMNARMNKLAGEDE